MSLEPRYYFVSECNGVSPGYVGRAKCTGNVGSCSLRRLWESTALSLQVGPLAYASVGGWAKGALGLECRWFL